MNYSNNERVVDISDHQLTVNPNVLLSENIKTVMLRSKYSIWADDKFESFAKKLSSAGLKLGSYCFCRFHYSCDNNRDEASARVQMRQEISRFIKSLSDKKISSWVAIDQELEKNKTMGLSKTVNTRLLNEAASILINSGYTPCLYCSASWIKSFIDVDKLKMKIWVAYYYSRPNADPSFDTCKRLDQIQSDYSRYIISLGNKIIGWQFGSMGYGDKYGVSSSGIDRNWFYSQPRKDNNMTNLEWINVSNKRLKAISTKPKCESFPEPDVNSGPVIAIPENDSVEIIAVTKAPCSILNGKISAKWYKVRMQAGIRYCFGMTDRWLVIDKPVDNKPVEKPVVNRSQLSITINNPSDEQIKTIVSMIK